MAAADHGLRRSRAESVRLDHKPPGATAAAANATTIANAASGIPRNENATSDGWAFTCFAARHQSTADRDPLAARLGPTFRPKSSAVG